MKKFWFFSISFLSVLLTPLFVLADEYSLDGTARQAGLTGYGSDAAVILGNVIGTALAMVGVLFFGLMIYGGVMWMTDRGNEERSKKALHTITASVIGVTIILASYAITNFVFRAGGAFQTPAPAQNPNFVPRDNAGGGTSSGGSGEQMGPPERVGVCCMYNDTNQSQLSTGFNAAQWVWESDDNATDECTYLCGFSQNLRGCTVVDIPQDRCSI